MSDVKFYCPECGARLSVSEEVTGRPVACPDCSARIPIPPLSGSSSPPEGKILSLDLRFLCPCCEKKLAAAAIHAGAALRCPKCKEEISVPRIGPGLLPVAPSASRTQADSPNEQPSSRLSEDEVAFLLAPD